MAPPGSEKKWQITPKGRDALTSGNLGESTNGGGEEGMHEDDSFLDEGPDETEQGPGYVYVYTYPCLLKLARFEHTNALPYKVGCTKYLADVRIKKQTAAAKGTAISEEHMLIGTLKVQEFKKAECIQSVLKLWRKQTPNIRGTGTEWFITTIQEIDSVWNTVRTGYCEPSANWHWLMQAREPGLPCEHANCAGCTLTTEDIDDDALH